VRALLVLLVATAALAAAAVPATAADRVVERGIVQATGPTAVVLRALDGTEITVPVGPETRYRLNGRRATSGAVRRGFVAEAVTVGSGPAIVIRAFGRVADRIEVGRLMRVRPRVLVLRRGPGDTIRIPVTARTTVWRAGGRVGVRALRPGMGVEVVLRANGVARVVLVQQGTV
jgi:hypothetical protein